MESVCRKIVGMVGGMVSYAAVHCFRRILHAFPVDKEWERPRVIIDNNCVMPNRVRAILYGKRREELVEQLAEAIRGMPLRNSYVSVSSKSRNPNGMVSGNGLLTIWPA
jgi:xanthosine utilization system XapX-like protein